jgi:hypothetical protein
MSNSGYDPNCRKCGRRHYNFKPCDQVSPLPQIQWRPMEGWHEWGDLVKDSGPGKRDSGGWGCKTILPSKGVKDEPSN